MAVKSSAAGGIIANGENASAGRNANLSQRWHQCNGINRKAAYQ